MARIEVALCLPSPDVEALAQGRIMVATPRLFIRPGRQFALCPSYALTPLPVEQAYCSSFLHIAKRSLDSSQAEKFLIKAWARCEMCQEYRDSGSLNILSKLTIWTSDLLQEILAANERIFLSYLRVYLLDNPIEIPIKDENRAKTFIPLPSYWITTEHKPVLDSAIFLERKRHLENLKAPHHPELENLYEATTKLTVSNSEAKEFARDIEVFLGWAKVSTTEGLVTESDWIKMIVSLGNRSKELDEGKSNYQAGTDFENIVQRSLNFLGFTVDQAYRGGAGGLDLFCSKPYPLVGECKAGKGIRSGTTEELIKLGGMRLESTDQFLESAKLIIGPGNPTSDLLTAAAKWRVSIINPMSLQKLVELKSKYPGSIDLLELKKYLEPGQIDSRIDEYVEKTLAEIKVRSHIIEAVKQLIEIEPDRKQFEVIEIRAQYNAAFSRHDGSGLDNQTVHEFLIELSSPLTGYLGRVQGTSLQTDRFYFLRDLPMD